QPAERASTGRTPGSTEPGAERRQARATGSGGIGSAQPAERAGHGRTPGVNGARRREAPSAGDGVRGDRKRAARGAGEHWTAPRGQLAPLDPAARLGFRPAPSPAMPETFPTTPRASRAVRLGAIAIGLLAVGLATRTTITSAAWVGRVFPGFFLLD